MTTAARFARVDFNRTLQHSPHRGRRCFLPRGRLEDSTGAHPLARISNIIEHVPQPHSCALRVTFRVIAPDYPGYGFSGMPDRKVYSYTFENMTNDRRGAA